MGAWTEQMEDKLAQLSRKGYSEEMIALMFSTKMPDFQQQRSLYLQKIAERNQGPTLKAKA